MNPTAQISKTPALPPAFPAWANDHFGFFVRFYRRNIEAKTFVGQFLRKARRFYLGTFHADYIRESVAKERQGECHRCGLCCQLIYKCPFLGKDSQSLPYCRIYGDLRPVNCGNYPFDAIDSEIEMCGFKFKRKD